MLTTGSLLAALLAAGAVGVVAGLPRPGARRLADLRLPDGPLACPPGVAGLAAGRSPGQPWGQSPDPHPGPSGLRRPFTVLVVLGVTGVGALVGPLPALLLGLVLAVVRRSATTRATARRHRDERRRAVEACSALAGELRAGRTPGAALTVAGEVATGPFGSALLGAAATAGLGGDVPAGLLAAVAPRASGPATAVPEVLRALAACWTVCSSSGAGLAAAVERLEQGLRDDQQQRRAVDAELAGPRATAGLLAMLPLAGLLLATGLGADPVGVLLDTPLGLACLTGGVLLDGLGLLWTGRMVARAGGTV